MSFSRENKQLANGVKQLIFKRLRVPQEMDFLKKI